ncbi:formamidopyrimidine-DNA glycosylase [bacterium BMS3Abin01]|nr:formamidopyrimidine-DNA glycosylase [bacterium BMS3Abin01]
MPELPEVETIRRQLDPLVRDRIIGRVEIPDPTVAAPWSAARFRRAISGKRIQRLTRRGKYLRFELADGETLVIHLRMTGRLTHLERRPGGDRRRHLRLLLHLDDGTFIAFHDTRRLGKAFIIPAGDSRAYWQKLGPEPLGRSFTPARLAKMTAGRDRQIKTLLMDQSFIAGIGNIYADEALFDAGIDPRRPAGKLTQPEITRLHSSIRKTLKKAIRLEGSSIDSYVNARGEKGGFQETFQVHRRQGEPCPRCGHTIEKIRVGGRGTYFCPYCQKL